jgi:hypothetical protein
MGTRERSSVVSNFFSSRDILDNPVNRKHIARLKRTSQHPAGYESIVSHMGSANLPEIMAKENVSKIIHLEGPTVWEHTLKTIDVVDEIGLSPEKADELRIIMLYHDVGKPSVIDRPENIKLTEKRKAEGKLLQACIGHADENLDLAREGFRENGIPEEKIEPYVNIIKNHMLIHRLDKIKDKDITLAVMSLGRTDEERRKNLELLEIVSLCDGRGTLKVEIDNGNVKYGNSVLPFDKERMWETYREGKKKIEDQREKERLRVKVKEVFGKEKPGHYFMSLGFEGPEIGKVMKKVERMVEDKHSLPPEEIKKQIDEEFKLLYVKEA